MKTPIDPRRIFAYMGGFWQFTREVRSSPERIMMALVVDGKASFLPRRKCHSVDGPGNQGAPSSDNFRNGSSSDSVIANNKALESLLYREYGILNSMDQPAAKGPVTRQFLYERNGSDVIEAFNSSMRVKTPQQQDPWCKDFLNEEVEKLDYFHQLLFELPENESACQKDNDNCVHDLDGCVARTNYLCEPDTYKAEFLIIDDDHMRVTWSVKGPKKSYTIESAYTRKLLP